MKPLRTFTSFARSTKCFAPPSFAQDMLLRNIHEIRSGYLLRSSQPSYSAPSSHRHRLPKSPMEGERTIEAELSSTSSSSPLPVMEGGGAAEKEVAMKQNTDCVNFLASPRTCKKGKDCEYRHSEGARVNSRDCRYWLIGNCLNPKCSFRHLLPGGLIGIPGVSSLPNLPSPTVETPQILDQHSSTSHNPKKQSDACYFFQKEHCMKGDKCPFVHVPQSIGLHPTGTPFPQQVIRTSASFVQPPKTVKKESLGLMACAQQKIPVLTIEKPVETLPLSRNFASRLQGVPSNGWVDGQVMPGKRLRHREESPDEADKSDLQYRLLKQRRLHGLRSVVRPNCHEAEKYCSHHSSKYQQHFVPKSSSIRLQGRIHFFARNSPDRPIDPHPERQRHRERHNDRLSPTMPTLYQERHSDTMKHKLPDDFVIDARSIRSHSVRRLDSNHLKDTVLMEGDVMEYKDRENPEQTEVSVKMYKNDVLRMEEERDNPEMSDETYENDVLMIEEESDNTEVSDAIYENDVLMMEEESDNPEVSDETYENDVLMMEEESDNTEVLDETYKNVVLMIEEESDNLEVSDETYTNDVLMMEEESDHHEVSNETYENDVLMMEEERDNLEVSDETYQIDMLMIEAKSDNPEVSDEMYENDVLMIEEESDDHEHTEETGEVYEEDVLWTENEERENPEEAFEAEYLNAGEDGYEECDVEFSDDNEELDFGAKVALLFS